jgi:hypothetical protein
MLIAVHPGRQLAKQGMVRVNRFWPMVSKTAMGRRAIVDRPADRCQPGSKRLDTRLLVDMRTYRIWSPSPSAIRHLDPLPIDCAGSRSASCGSYRCLYREDSHQGSG